MSMPSRRNGLLIRLLMEDDGFWQLICINRQNASVVPFYNFLNCFSFISGRPRLCLESRSSLIVSAGSVLQCLPKDKMQKYHYKLGLVCASSRVMLSPLLMTDLSILNESLQTFLH